MSHFVVNCVAYTVFFTLRNCMFLLVLHLIIVISNEFKQNGGLHIRNRQRTVML